MAFAQRAVDELELQEEYSLAPYIDGECSEGVAITYGVMTIIYTPKYILEGRKCSS